ncbi:MAG: hypothetical protein JEZ02_14830 [Desulfatibacillum sp.]|nr:hypothetical protein [Desulfatibacillum sp.]
MKTTPTATASQAPEKWDRLRLYLASFLGLFIELAYIRFIPAHVRVVGYYTNVVLIASFLGLGLGFMIASKKIRTEKFLLPLIILIVYASGFFSTVLTVNRANGAEPFWLHINLYKNAATTTGPEMGIGLVVLIHFLLVAISLIPVGQVMGRYFSKFPRLSAYSLDLGGSLTGVVAFGVLSALGATPMLWFGLASVIILFVMCRGWKEKVAGFVLSVCLLMMVWSMGSNEIWSPYYMVELDSSNPDGQVIYVNKTLHQVMVDFDSPNSSIQQTRGLFETAYKAAHSLDDVLIVGAGSGNDVAIALSMGAKHIDAVEIDPVFPVLGRKYHKQHPYDSPKVTLHINDARAYFKTCKKKYDLVVFGTLDSQALMGHLSSIRMDNYIYTVEAFQEARNLLKSRGVIAVFHMSIKEHIYKRIHLLLTANGGPPPLMLEVEKPTLFNYLFLQGEGIPGTPTRGKDQDLFNSLKISTDDWPFLYLEKPSLPWHYGQVIIGMILIALFGSMVVTRGKIRNFDLRLFLLGAGFLLLETKSVTQLSLLFGSTWMVNLLVFSSILLVLFLGNLLVLKWDRSKQQINTKRLFLILVIVLVASAFAPVSWVAGHHPLFRWLLGGLLVAVPIGLAGLIFPLVFRQCKDPQMGFASNLLGAILGGCLEYSTMVFGIRSLTLIAALLYIVASMTRPSDA